MATHATLDPSKRAQGKQPLSRIGLWIAGKLVPGSSGRSGPVFNPATGEQSAELAYD